MAAEGVVRARTRNVVRSGIVVGVILFVLVFFADSPLRWILLAFAVLSVLGALVALATRTAALAVLRRVGGREYRIVRPIVARRWAELREATSELPTSPIGVLQLLRPTRREALKAQIRATGATLAEHVPATVAEVQAELAETAL
jgi:hypothetical protein